MSLLSKLLGKSREHGADENTRVIVLPKREEEKPTLGGYLLPPTLRADGIYAIEISQAEMYDLGNIKFIPHFFIYDRQEKVAVDITSDIKPAPLLSATRPAEVTGGDVVELLEKYLTGEIKPEFTSDFPQGIKYFRAYDMNGDAVNLRERITTLRNAKTILDDATKNFRADAVSVGKKYFKEEELK